MLLQDLKQALNETWVRVEFTKVDGSHRSMLCTRNFAEIPADHIPSGAGKKSNDTMLSVFDLEKQGWRSIKIDNIQNWKVEITHDK